MVIMEQEEGFICSWRVSLWGVYEDDSRRVTEDIKQHLLHLLISLALVPKPTSDIKEK